MTLSNHNEYFILLFSYSRRLFSVVTVLIFVTSFSNDIGFRNEVWIVLFLFHTSKKHTCGIHVIRKDILIYLKL